MDITHFLIGAMLLIQFSIYAQSTGQVTLSIRLYPIQIIEVEPSSNAQTIEIPSQDVLKTSNQSTAPPQISTFSTSQFALKVDSVNCNAFNELRTSNTVPSLKNRLIDGIFDAQRYDKEIDGDDLHIVYSMETL